MQDHAIAHVPPNSTALRELARAIETALTLPAPATTRDELTYLRISRDRMRLVREALNRLLRDRETGDEEVMVLVAWLRDHVAQLCDDQYDHRPDPS